MCAAMTRIPTGPREKRPDFFFADCAASGAVGVGAGQDRGEAVADRVGEVLGALATGPREALGEPREARHVDEHHRAVDGLDLLRRRRGKASKNRPRHVRIERTDVALPSAILHTPTLRP